MASPDSPEQSGLDVAAILRGVLAGLFDVAAGIAAPVLVHPVLGQVSTRVEGLWPASLEGRSQPPPRLFSPGPLRTYLLGSSAQSQRMGKLDLLGLGLDALQAAWSTDGDTIGAATVRIVDDGSAPSEVVDLEPLALTLTASDVRAVWGLDPLADDDDTGAALAACYAELISAAVADRADDAAFQAASEGRPLTELLAEARGYLADSAEAWLAAVLGLVRLRAAQERGDGGPDVLATLDRLVTTYNETIPDPPPTLFQRYLRDDVLDGHPSVRPLADGNTSVDGDHFTDALRSAIRHAATGGPVLEDGGSTDDSAPNVAAPAPGAAIVTAALALADRVHEYTQDPAHRWDDDKADSSSFVQRALAGAGHALFDPGPDHTDAWNSLAFATRDDVFVTVATAAAEAGDLLVQGGFRTIGGEVTWRAHVGVCTQPSPAGPGLLEGVSMDAHGPRRNGLWGADPPRGSYSFGTHLLVRRLRADVLGAAGPVVPDAGPPEGGTRVRVDGRGLAGVTRVTVGGVDAVDVAQDPDGGSVYLTLPPGAEGGCNLVITDAAGRSRTLPAAIRYVADLTRAASAVVASYEIATLEVIDLCTGLVARGQATEEERARLGALLGLRLAAIDRGWAGRLATLGGQLPGPAVDQVFTAAQRKLTALSERAATLLAI